MEPNLAMAYYKQKFLKKGTEVKMDGLKYPLDEFTPIEDIVLRRSRPGEMEDYWLLVKIGEYYYDTAWILDIKMEPATPLNKEESKMAELKDSGERRDFGTGAVRDAAEGKGRCDLLPLVVVGSLIDSEELKLIGEFKGTKNPNCLLEAVRIFSFKTNIDLATMMIEVSKQFEDGAKKYAENNWMRGIPLHCYIDSGTRHFLKFLRGDTDEPHDRAFVWNMICAVWTLNNKPEMDDIEKDLFKSVVEIQDQLVRPVEPIIPIEPINYFCTFYDTCSYNCSIYEICTKEHRKNVEPKQKISKKRSIKNE